MTKHFRRRILCRLTNLLLQINLFLREYQKHTFEFGDIVRQIVIDQNAALRRNYTVNKLLLIIHGLSGEVILKKKIF